MRFLSHFLSVLTLAWGIPASAGSSDDAALTLRSVAQSDSAGIFLNDIAQGNVPMPALRLADAPVFGKTVLLNRAQIGALLQAHAEAAGYTNWAGAEAVVVGRRSRVLGEKDALDRLTGTLQDQLVKDRGELELRFSRPWAVQTVPDEPLSVKVIDLPTVGVVSAFIMRFELVTAKGEHLGPWQAALQAHVWREVWVARSALKRGDSLREADLLRERRDLLLCRDAHAEFDRDDANLEAAEAISPGTILLARSVKPRPVIHRGQTIGALLQDGALAITLKVEALEEGAPGQVIRVRNLVSRRDLRGRVVDEQNIIVLL